MPADPETDGMARRFLQYSLTFLAACAITAFLLAGPLGCTLFQPQTEIAQLCTRITDRNAGVTCVKAGYAAIADLANLTARRYEAGAISKGSAEEIASLLATATETVELAEIATFSGRLSDAEGQMNAAIELLTLLEARLQ